MAIQAADRILKEVDTEISEMVFYTNSKVVLGYICNETRRFQIYVAICVQTITKISSPNQWRYVESSVNPASLAMCGIHPKDLVKSNWLHGALFLQNTKEITESGIEQALMSPDSPEVRKTVRPLATRASSCGPRALQKDSKDSLPGIT